MLKTKYFLCGLLWEGRSYDIHSAVSLLYPCYCSDVCAKPALFSDWPMLSSNLAHLCLPSTIQLPHPPLQAVTNVCESLPAMASLVPSIRTRIPRVAAYAVRTSRPLSTSSRLLRQGPGTGENFEQANDPSPRRLTPNVSKSDETPTDAMGARDAPLQEMVPEGEKSRQLQAPNRSKPWSRSQMPRELAMTGPRFEQTIIEAQV